MPAEETVENIRSLYSQIKTCANSCRVPYLPKDYEMLNETKRLARSSNIRVSRTTSADFRSYSARNETTIGQLPAQNVPPACQIPMYQIPTPQSPTVQPYTNQPSKGQPFMLRASASTSRPPRSQTPLTRVPGPISRPPASQALPSRAPGPMSRPPAFQAHMYPINEKPMYQASKSQAPTLQASMSRPPTLQAPMYHGNQRPMYPNSMPKAPRYPVSTQASAYQNSTYGNPFGTADLGSLTINECVSPHQALLMAR